MDGHSEDPDAEIDRVVDREVALCRAGSQAALVDDLCAKRVIGQS